LTLFQLLYLQNVDTIPPKISGTNRPINYAPPSKIPYISRKAPSLQDVATGRSTKRKATSTKMPAQKKSAKGSSSSAQPANPAVTAKLLATALQVSYSAVLTIESTISHNTHLMENSAGITSTNFIGPSVISSFSYQSR
jgi:hypothetical protein